MKRTVTAASHGLRPIMIKRHLEQLLAKSVQLHLYLSQNGLSADSADSAAQKSAFFASLLPVLHFNFLAITLLLWSRHLQSFFRSSHPSFCAVYASILVHASFTHSFTFLSSSLVFGDWFLCVLNTADLFMSFIFCHVSSNISPRLFYGWAGGKISAAPEASHGCIWNRDKKARQPVETDVLQWWWQFLLYTCSQIYSIPLHFVVILGPFRLVITPPITHLTCNKHYT